MHKHNTSVETYLFMHEEYFISVGLKILICRTHGEYRKFSPQGLSNGTAVDQTNNFG